jgi:hypothetical protein
MTLFHKEYGGNGFFTLSHQVTSAAPLLQAVMAPFDLTAIDAVNKWFSSKNNFQLLTPLAALAERFSSALSTVDRATPRHASLPAAVQCALGGGVGPATSVGGCVHGGWTAALCGTVPHAGLHAARTIFVDAVPALESLYAQLCGESKM